MPQLLLVVLQLSGVVCVLTGPGVRAAVPNGSIDPWHALSITSPPGPQRDSVVPIFIQGTAHCANMYPASSSDLPGLTAARKEITNQLGKWLPAPSTTA